MIVSFSFYTYKFIFKILDNEDEESPETLDDTILYTTVQIRSKSIKTADLISVIKSMESDTDKGFTEEFNVRTKKIYKYQEH